VTARPAILAFSLAIVALPQVGSAKERARAKVAKPKDRVVDEKPDVPPDHEGWLFQGSLGGGYAPGGALVLAQVGAAYRFPWDELYVELHGDYGAGVSGGSLSQMLLAGGRLGGMQLGTSGLSGWVGLGLRRIALAMPFGDGHAYTGAAFEGALYGNISPDWRAEGGVELVYPASASTPMTTDLVIGAGTHILAEYKSGDLGIFARFDLLDFHARFATGSTDDLSYVLSVGVRSRFW
jgi:hypothetical protein